MSALLRFLQNVLFSFLFLPALAWAAPTLDELLAYERASLSEVKVVGTQKIAEGNIEVQDLEFDGTKGDERVQAYLVRPAAVAGSHPAVLYVHWFGPPEPDSNRTQFLEEAKEGARKGIVSLLVSTYWSDPARYERRTWQTDFDNSLRAARSLRRGLDILAAQPGVDARRIALVGHDYGAMYGSLVAAVDTRVSTLVFIAGTGRFPEWFMFGSATGVPKGDERAAFFRQFVPIDPVNVIGLSHARVFLQFGEKDMYTPRRAIIALYEAAPEPKRIATYPSEHEMRAPIIRTDREQWLHEQLFPQAAPQPAAH